MRIPAVVALVATCLCLAAPAHRLMAQNFQGSSAPASGNDNSDSFTFVLKLGEAELQALRNGQSLQGKIPPELRGVVTTVRLDYTPDPGNPAAATPPINFSGVAGGSPLGPQLPAGIAPGQAAGNRFPGGPDQPVSTTPGSFNRGGGTSSTWNPAPGNTTPPNAPPNLIESPQSGVPAFAPPNLRDSGGFSASGGSGFAPQPPQTQPLQTAPSTTAPFSGNATGSGQWSPPNGESPPPVTLPGNPAWQGQGIPSSQGNSSAPARPGEVDTAGGRNWNGQEIAPPNGMIPGGDTAPSNRFADSRFDGYRPGQPANAANSSTPSGLAQRNGSLVTGYQMPAIPRSGNPDPGPSAGILPPSTGWGNPAATAAGSLVGGQHPSGPHVEPLTPGLPPVASTDSSIARFNGFLYFMLLSSIGLNIYLGWISRGFYVRYRELADELRESFATI